MLVVLFYMKKDIIQHLVIMLSVLALIFCYLSPMMVITQKITSLAFEIHDGECHIYYFMFSFSFFSFENDLGWKHRLYVFGLSVIYYRL